MSLLQDLIAQVKEKDPQAGLDLDREFRALASRRQFGLNFERHRPEAVELPQRQIRKGDKVRVLPPRGESKKGDQRLWLVTKIDSGSLSKKATLKLIGSKDQETQTAPIGDLVVVAEFRDIIYPGLVSTGRIERGSGKPFHTVINAENYHALKALSFSHRGAIDAIYIDPPYNTGARDWKYNNNYVEGDDLYRHSKWLAMMERRLILAKELLNPADSVLVVTIDEKEYLRLGLLLEQTFPETRIQMVSSVINPKGATRSSAFGRTDEYLFFVMFGAAAPQPVALTSDWKVVEDRRAGRLRWAELLRSGSHTRRLDRPNQFYPVFICKGVDGPIFDSVGDTYIGKTWKAIKPPNGCVAVWPIRSDGSEGNWQNNAASLRELIKSGYARLGPWRGENTSIGYLKRGEQRKVEAGVFPVVGRRPDDSIIVNDTGYKPSFIPGTQWRIPSHNAEQGGTNLLKVLIPNHKFPFPKSLHAVEDTLRFFVGKKPNATILDFFSGSGTTAHAVMRLNRQDGGSRQSISVTNNEVGADDCTELRSMKHRAGDAEWEDRGICDFVTKPRIKAAISGTTADGTPIPGDYKFTDEFAMADGFAENAEFFTLTYETPVAVSNHLAFARIAPLLWLRAGSIGRRIDKLPPGGWDVTDSYGLLIDLDRASAFTRAVAKMLDLRVAYIVTDDERRFQAIVRRLPFKVEPVRLYESYLTNFSFASGE